MTRSIFEGKQILAVDDDPDILEVLEEEILEACPNCRFDKATTYIQAVERMLSLTYDLVILDIMGVRGLDLLELAVSRTFPVVMLTLHPANPEGLKYLFKMGVHAFISKEKLGEAVPLLEDVLRHEYKPGWQKVLEKLGKYLSGRWREDWAGMEERIWEGLLGK